MNTITIKFETVSFPINGEVWRITRSFQNGAWMHHGYPSKKKDGKHMPWRHVIGCSGKGYADWTVTHSEGLNPRHRVVDKYFKNYDASLGRREAIK